MPRERHLRERDLKGKYWSRGTTETKMSTPGWVRRKRSPVTSERVVRKESTREKDNQRKRRTSPQSRACGTRWLRCSSCMFPLLFCTLPTWSYFAETSATQSACALLVRTCVRINDSVVYLCLDVVYFC